MEHNNSANLLGYSEFNIFSQDGPPRPPQTPNPDFFPFERAGPSEPTKGWADAGVGTGIGWGGEFPLLKIEKLDSNDCIHLLN